MQSRSCTTRTIVHSSKLKKTSWIHPIQNYQQVQSHHKKGLRKNRTESNWLLKNNATPILLPRAFSGSNWYISSMWQCRSSMEAEILQVMLIQLGLRHKRLLSPYPITWFHVLTLCLVYIQVLFAVSTVTLRTLFCSNIAIVKRAQHINALLHDKSRW